MDTPRISSPAAVRLAPISIAVIGAGPVGLVLALQAARMLPQARITVFDARAIDQDVSRDGRTLALSLGSLQVLERLGVWDGAIAPHSAPISTVHVSQQQPALVGGLLPAWLRERLLAAGEPEVLIEAAELGVPQLGAVASYGAIVAPMQAAWLAAVEQEPQRLSARFGAKVAALKAVDGGLAGNSEPATGAGDRSGRGVEVDAGIAERFDLAVVAEGGVFADHRARQAAEPRAPGQRAPLVHDYRQTAWVGQLTLARPMAGLAVERFTPHGPAALLPLPAGADGQHRAALVWCVPTDDDPVRELSDAQRVALLNTIYPERVPTLTGITPLKAFALGLSAERTLVDGRQVRIGNAAQTLHPVAGQGLNLGLRDVHALLTALRDAADIDTALRKVEWQRAPDRWSLIAATDFLARSFTWSAPGLSTARGFGLAALQALGPAKRMLARQMMFGAR